MKDSIAAISEFIFLETPISSADIILIPGGHPRQLMERTAALYHQGLASLVLPSGGITGGALIVPGLSEWEHLKNIGVSLGIPEQAFLREDKATNTLQNAELSWKVIVEAGLEISAAIIVCKAFHARRAYMSYRAVFPSRIQLMVSPIHDERDIRKDNWHRTHVGISKVMNEMEKIGQHFGPHVEKARDI